MGADRSEESTSPKADGGEGSTALASLGNVDIHSVVESPYVTDPAEVAALDVPREYVRRMEDAQRIYGEHHLQYRAFQQAKSHGRMTVGLQCFWLTVGAWVVNRGYHYSDPLNSLVARWVTSTSWRRLTTPISSLGILIFVVTCTQLPFDVSMMYEASQGLEKERKIMAAAMRLRDEAYQEGRAESEKLKQQEHEALNALLKKS